MRGKRPCHCDDVERCRKCRLYYSHDGYNRSWGGPGLESLNRDSPSLFQKAANYTTALAHHIAAGLPQTSPEEVARRVSICEGCVLFQPLTRECTHRSCGCQVDKKTPWLDQSCPLKKW